MFVIPFVYIMPIFCCIFWAALVSPQRPRFPLPSLYPVFVTINISVMPSSVLRFSKIYIVFEKILIVLPEDKYTDNKRHRGYKTPVVRLPVVLYLPVF